MASKAPQVIGISVRMEERVWALKAENLDSNASFATYERDFGQYLTFLNFIYPKESTPLCAKQCQVLNK